MLASVESAATEMNAAAYDDERPARFTDPLLA
jgi:hypothetical protein